MKVNDITLQVRGREMTFSEEELTAILEKHFSEEPTEPAEEVVKAESIETKATKYDVAPTPIEGKCFEVYPMKINRNLFIKERDSFYQEKIRLIILEAFEAVYEYPEKYANDFKTFIPSKTWDGSKTIDWLTKYAEELGNHMADWVEQALEWAQRISNGESWEILCENPDLSKWYRLVNWKWGRPQLIGGSKNDNSRYENIGVSATGIDYYNNIEKTGLYYAVPLVIL